MWHGRRRHWSPVWEQVVTWVTQEETEWQLIWVTSIFIQSFSVRGEEITAKRRGIPPPFHTDASEIQHSVKSFSLLRKTRSSNLQKTRHTLLQSATKKDNTQHSKINSQGIYCVTTWQKRTWSRDWMYWRQLSSWYCWVAIGTSGCKHSALHSELNIRSALFTHHQTSVPLNHLLWAFHDVFIYFFSFLNTSLSTILSFHILCVTFFQRPNVWDLVASSGYKEYCRQCWH